jgi:hypothetical protein
MSIEDGLRLADREAIRDVLHRYCRGIDRQDVALLKSCYHVDAFDQHASFTGSGHDFCDYAMQQVAAALFTQHRCSNELIEFDGERAFVETYVHAIHRMESGGKLLDYIHFGRYCDLFERRDGAWKIAYRLHLPDGDNVVEIEEPAGRGSRPQDRDPARPYVRGARGPDDASFLKFDLAKARLDLPPVMAPLHAHGGGKT